MPIALTPKEILAASVLGTFNPSALQEEERKRREAFAQTRALANPAIQESPNFIGRSSLNLGIKAKELAAAMTDESVRDVFESERTEGLSRILRSPGRLHMEQGPSGEEMWSFKSWPVGPPPSAGEIAGRAETLKRIPWIAEDPEMVEYLNSVATGQVQGLDPEQIYQKVDASTANIVRDYGGSTARTRYELERAHGVPYRDSTVVELAKENLTKYRLPLSETYIADETRRIRQEAAMPEQQFRDKWRNASALAATLVNKGYINKDEQGDVILQTTGLGSLVLNPMKAAKQMASWQKAIVALENNKSFYFDERLNQVVYVAYGEPGTKEFASSKTIAIDQYKNMIDITARTLQRRNAPKEYYEAFLDEVDETDEGMAKLSDKEKLAYYKQAAKEFNVKLSEVKNLPEEKQQEIADRARELYEEEKKGMAPNRPMIKFNR